MSPDDQFASDFVQEVHQQAISQTKDVALSLNDQVRALSVVTGKYLRKLKAEIDGTNFQLNQQKAPSESLMDFSQGKNRA